LIATVETQVQQLTGYLKELDKPVSKGFLEAVNPQTTGSGGGKRTPKPGLQEG
jgi:hypothetical protein